MKNKYHRILLGKDENGKKIFIDEHRLIMELYIKRKLKRNEIVHHINKDKSDNRIENLTIMTLSEHSKLHNLNRKLSLEQKEKISKKLKNRKSPTRNKDKEDIINIIDKYIELKCYRKVDRYFKLSNGTTRNIIKGYTYNDFQYIVKEKLNMNIV